MGLLDKFKKKDQSGAEPKKAEVFVATPHLYAGKDGHVFGAFALTEGVLTGLPSDPKRTFTCQGKPVEDWRVLLMSTTKDSSVGELDYYDALSKLKEFSIGEKDGYTIIRPLTLEEQLALVNG